MEIDELYGECCCCFVQWAEIRTTNEGVNPLGKTAVENHEDEYEPDAEDEDADNGEEGSEVEEFEQEAN